MFLLETKRVKNIESDVFAKQKGKVFWSER